MPPFFLALTAAVFSPSPVLPALALASPSWPPWLKFFCASSGNCCLCGLLQLSRFRALLGLKLLALLSLGRQGGATATQLGSQLFAADSSLPHRARTSSSRPRPPKFPLERSFPLAGHAPMLITLQFFTFVLCGFPPLCRLPYCLALLTRAPPLPLRTHTNNTHTRNKLDTETDRHKDRTTDGHTGKRGS